MKNKLKTKNYALSEEIKEYLMEPNSQKEYSKLSKRNIEKLKENMPDEFHELKILDSKQKHFILEKNETLKINYNKSSKWIALNGTSQLTVKKVFAAFNMEFNSDITPKENFISLIEKVGLHKFLKWICDGIKNTDYFLVIPGNFKNINLFITSFFDFDFKKSDVESNILTTYKNKSTWIVNVGGLPLFQIQAPPSSKRPNNQITRINTDSLEKYYQQLMKKTNETLGISVEVAMCKINNILIPKNYNKRWDPKLVERLIPELEDFIKEQSIPDFTEILATETKGSKKSPTDFMAGEISVSVKSNMKSSQKVCPPEIGQPGLNEGLEYYNKTMGTSFSKTDFLKENYLEFKKAFQNNIEKIVLDQIKNLFSEDKILYVRELTKSWDIHWVDTNKKLPESLPGEFTFTRSPEEWNESTTIKYNGISLAEMQMHSSRAPFKFRFNLVNLLKILKNNQ